MYHRNHRDELGIGRILAAFGVGVFFYVVFWLLFLLGACLVVKSVFFS